MGPIAPTAIMNDPTGTSALGLAARKRSREDLLVLLAEAIRHRPADEQRQILDHARHIPTRYLRTYAKAVGDGPASAAIKAHCLECVCWQQEEVRLCCCPNCTLFRRRPYR